MTERPAANRRRLLIIAGVALAVIVGLSFLPYGCDWTGFGTCAIPNPNGEAIRFGKTLWDWLELVSIPLVLAAGGWQFIRTVERNERLRISTQAETERVVTTERLHEEALHTYLDNMTDLVLERHLRDAAPDDARALARARTLTILQRVGPRFREAVLRFLIEVEIKGVVDLGGANLADLRMINFDLSTASLVAADLSNSDLTRANLTRANLTRANLTRANLAHAMLPWAKLAGANLSGAYLGDDANLKGAELLSVNLSGANLNGAVLVGHDLRGANLSGASLVKAELRSNMRDANLANANLTGASMSGADLSGANLTNTVMQDVDLRGANLSGARITMEQLQTCRVLTNVIMPNGTVHD